MHIRSFVFCTRLIVLNRDFKNESFQEVLKNLSEQVPYWSGGTRIGASFEAFRQGYASKLLNNRSVMIILSDGWDTGDPGELEDCMRYFHKKAEKVIWLNPLAGNPDYKPETKAMKLALPYIDIFAAAHNLETLQEVARYV